VGDSFTAGIYPKNDCYKVLTIDGEGRGIVRQDLGNCRGKLSWGQVRPFSNLLCTCPPIGMIKYKRIHAMKSLINNEIANKLHTPKHTVCGWKWKGGRKVVCAAVTDCRLLGWLHFTTCDAHLFTLPSAERSPCQSALPTSRMMDVLRLAQPEIFT